MRALVVTAFTALAASALAGCAAPMQAEQRPGSAYDLAPGYGPDRTTYQAGRASFYSERLAGHRTASGEPYDPRDLTAAHRSLPFGTLVDVARPDGRHVTVRINDRGPYIEGRIIDLSRRAASEIGLRGVGHVMLRLVWVPPP